MEQTQTATASAVQESQTPTPNVSGDPVADSDPFNVGVIITTDPNAAPMLDLTPYENWYEEEPASGNTGNDSSSETVGFSGIPDSFFDGE